MADKLTCSKCGKTKAKEKNFYMSHSPIYSKNSNRIHICKDCTLERYEGLKRKYSDDLKALYHLCMNLDIYFSKDLASSIYEKLDKSKEENLPRTYFSKVNSLSQYKGLSSLDSDIMILDEFIVKELLANKDNIKSFEPTLEIIKRWGRGYSNDEYEELEERYEEWLANHDHDTLATEKLFREIVELELLKGKARQNNEARSYKDFSDLLSKKMGDANIKPTQKKSLADGEGETYGTTIEEIEKTMPCVIPSEEFEDVDKIYHYIVKYFVKPFARVVGLADANGEDEIELHENIQSSIDNVGDTK